ncbi:MAG: aldo/keto reductase [Deltaproteobacteria bacterium]|nr:aldo/keto reductase [Deltaproteobacteria bacterium]MBN2672743.1 aldo/keto reductase [Deltaproteobacteria bacterium]
MQYRPFGKDRYPVSALGFGAMRFPVKDNHTVDEDAAIELLRYGIDKGINYVDTAYIYHDGRSEEIVGRALKDGYREKVRVATKSPGHLVKNAADFDRILDEQLRRLDMDYVDYYMFHGIGKAGLEDIQREKLFDSIEKAKQAGKIGHIGFSFHDNTEAFISICDAYDGWEYCYMQYNYMDVAKQAGREGLMHAADKGISIVVMEPLLGGRLANPPKDVADMMASHHLQRSAAEWSLSWIWNHPQVAMILSGMNSKAQIDENCRIADSAVPSFYAPQETAFIDQVQSVFAKRAVIPCTRCDYCKPCPEGIDIGWLLELYNDSVMHDNVGAPSFAYNTFVPEGHRAEDCTACAQCEDRCPQNIEISTWMPKVHETLKRT